MDTESRRCTASQFFMEEEQSATESLSTYDRVVELLNQASLLQKDTQRVNNLKLVQELIVHKEPNLLDNFLDEMLAFQSDRSTDVKKTLVNFIEDACKKDPDILEKVIGNLCLMLGSDVVPVVKKVILTMATLYKVSLQWVCKAKKMSETIEQTWDYVNQMKRDIIEMIDSDNEGFRTHSIKFVEAVIIALSRKTPESIVPASSQIQVSLDQVPETHELLKVKKLEEEGEAALETLLGFMGSVHISSVNLMSCMGSVMSVCLCCSVNLMSCMGSVTSVCLCCSVNLMSCMGSVTSVCLCCSVNLMTCMGSVTTIARQRPQFMARVVQSFETLHVNLPPTLSKSQVASVRKNMKLHMLSLLRHPAAVDFHAQITTLLTDLGATQTEVMKAMPKEDVSRKRKAEEKQLAAKKAKVQQPDATPSREEEDDYGMTPFVGLGVSAPKPTESLKQTAIDISAEDLIHRLTPQNVADLVLLSMVMLPDTMPAQFQATYTPIAAAGTQAQIKHLSRLLATQLTAANLGKGYAEIQQQLKKQTAQQAEEDDVEVGTSPKHVIQTVVGVVVLGGSVPSDEFKKPPLPVLAQPPSVPRKTRAFKLSSVTQTLDRASMDTMALRALERILLSEKSGKSGEFASAQMKIATSLVAQFGGQLKDELQNFIFADLRNRAEIALAWIYQEYANFQGYNLVTASAEKPNVASYDECLTRLLNGLLERPDQREGLFSRLILEAPYITPNAIQVLKKYCQDETRIYLGMTTLKELIVKRPCMKLEFLDVLLDFTSHEKNDVRNTAIRVTKKLHERKDLEEPIERYALYYLKYLLQSQPPAELPTTIHVTGDAAGGSWTEDTIKLCLYLYLGLLPVNHKLIHELANVYTGTKPDIKRTILRVLETPVKGMGMDSPELLLLVDNCPKGAETLITRIIHILTDKDPHPPVLVDRVRDLYHKRVSDVRFLIPVLTGLSKVGPVSDVLLTYYFVLRPTNILLCVKSY
ncbi:hypothetical protein NP493_413g00016 [Ridgeia piscesae]|uniref:Symplekin/Pta1 N-terminal domain-containing protein n=1 Tax=Ridgeia piscesae TaxID=27915 RepID=A0AAD9NSR7_RIDPI|nr:hypothetical protein NP493_413g00016 [Ridgeia piscesae]